MDPAEVGGQIVAAIKSNQFWLLPNGAPQTPLVQADFDEMLPSVAPTGQIVQ